jgi:adenosine deaminase
VDSLSIPKVELHLHLDCSLSFAVVSKIDPSIARQDYERDFIAPAKCLHLADYLTRARQGVALMQTEEELRLVVGDLFDQLMDDKVMYAEIRFAPHLHTEKGLTIEQVVDIVDGAVDIESERTGVESRLILCTLRHFNAEQSMQTVQLVQRFRGRRVAAIDIAGDEAGFPIDAHVPAFSYAIANSIARTAHAGEARGAESVWETLKHFQPTRIGHGVRSVEDSRLIDHLKEKRIHLEICPTSNVQTNIVSTHLDHQVDRLFTTGVSLGINTDARTISNVTLRSEYETLHEKFGWGIEHFRQCNLNAIDAAFLPESIKKEITGRLHDEYSSVL